VSNPSPRVSVTKTREGYLVRVGDQSEPLLYGPGSDYFLADCKRVAEALGVRGALIYEAVKNNVDAEAESILENDNPLTLIKEQLDHLIAGEEENKLLLFVLLLSAKTRDPDFTEMILFKSSSGGGKSTLANYLTGFYNTKKLGRVTRTALDYTDLQNYEVLYLQELGQLDSEEHGISTIKFLSTEDKGYTIEFTVRDKETGMFTTRTKHIPPLTVVSSTTRVNLDGQYERRNWILSVDETPEQTERIRKLQARQELEKGEVALGLRGETSADRARRVLEAVVYKIKPHPVVILFPDTLMGILQSPRLRIRGDFKKITRLVKYYAWLKAKTIPSVKVGDKTILFPRPQDALEILKVAERSLVYMAHDIEGRDMKLLEGMEALGLVNRGDIITPDLREELRLLLGYAKITILKYLNHLVDRGFLTDDDHKPKSFTLVHSLPAIKRQINAVSATIQDQKALKLEMLKEATKNLEALLAKKPELESLRQHFVYTPEGLNTNSQQSQENPYNDKIQQKRYDSSVLQSETARNAICKTPPGEAQDVSGGWNTNSQQAQNNLYREKTQQKQYDSTDLQNKTPQNAICKTPSRGTHAPIEDYLGDTKPRKPEQPPEEKPDPSIADLIERVQRAVWNHQEEQGRGPITFEALAERLGLDDKGLALVKRLVRSRMVENVVEVAPGRLAYTW